jgi:uncharacterized protein
MNFDETKIIQFALVMVESLLKLSNIDTGHGINHINAVLSHAQNAVSASNSKISDLQRISIYLAAILHDADDSKFFQTKDYSNAQNILRLVLHNTVDDNDARDYIYAKTLSMISLVSTRTNLNTDPGVEEYMLICRYADRLEAMGEIGILRAYEYTLYKNRPMYVESTIMCKNRLDIIKNINDNRFQQYFNGKTSVSFIDHFYDKLLHLVQLTEKCNNEYINQIALERHNIMIDFLVTYSKDPTNINVIIDDIKQRLINN